MSGKDETADICLLLEGTYPYVAGGVSTWTHDLIKTYKDKSFSLFTIVPPNDKLKLHYPIPENVTHLTTVRLQDFARGEGASAKNVALLKQMEAPLTNILEEATQQDFFALFNLFSEHGHKLGRRLLVESVASWDMLLRMYNKLFNWGSFLDFFWSMVVLNQSLLSVLIPPLPKAKIYHALTTGYSGVLLARAKKETNRPCLLTEHGIYVGERRIEIAIAEWLSKPESQDFSLDLKKKSLREYWLNAFTNYGRVCYSACDEIITLYKGNQDAQIQGGADPAKLKVIPNGIDVADYEHLKDTPQEHPPTVALIGRVVPIKDVKTYLRSVFILKEQIPNLKALVAGPTDEDKEYFEECQKMAQDLGLTDTVTFTGKIQLKELYPILDILILTSLSESQPLVILEAGACGIPSIATKVGSCPELLLGDQDDFGDGGIIIPLSNPEAAAKAMHRLFHDKAFYNKCSAAIKKRVHTFYRKEIQTEGYAKMYEKYLAVN